MQGVRVSPCFGIVIRKKALEQYQISRNDLFKMLQTSEPLDEDIALISFGPHFGKEAASEFISRLEDLGLTYGRDFLDFDDLLPEWCQVYMTCAIDKDDT